ncbi:hypothetical protein SFRURICE_017638 [Spodoptera frugiperda]|nr:hypothetical protein SFRURICE_017638 [Spodoptera frugiperda]
MAIGSLPITIMGLITQMVKNKCTVCYKMRKKRLTIRVHRPASYASYATDFSLSCIETHTTATTNPHRTHRIISNAYMCDA